MASEKRTRQQNNIHCCHLSPTRYCLREAEDWQYRLPLTMDKDLLPSPALPISPEVFTAAARPVGDEGGSAN